MTATIAFLGTGSMNGSIAAGLLAAGHDPAHIRATVRSEESRAALAQRLGDKVEIITTGGEADGNHKATAHADVVLLGVKPYGIVEVIRTGLIALERGEHTIYEHCEEREYYGKNLL